MIFCVCCVSVFGCVSVRWTWIELIKSNETNVLSTLFSSLLKLIQCMIAREIFGHVIQFHVQRKMKTFIKKNYVLCETYFQKWIEQNEIDISGSWTNGSFDFESWIRQWAMTFNNDAITTCGSKQQKKKRILNKVHATMKNVDSIQKFFFWHRWIFTRNIIVAQCGGSHLALLCNQFIDCITEKSKKSHKSLLTYVADLHQINDFILNRSRGLLCISCLSVGDTNVSFALISP